MSVLTYCDRVALGVIADYGSAPEADLLAHEIEVGVAELVAHARAARDDRGNDRRAVVIRSAEGPTRQVDSAL